MPIEPLYNHCFVCDQIGQNDLIPVGGGMLGSSDMPWKVNPDYQNFYPRFSTFVQPREAQFKTPEWHNYFSQNAPNADPELLQTLQAFTQANEGRRQIQSAAGRNATYRSSPNTTANLSDIFKNNQALCVEQSLLAKKYLDEHGIHSHLYSGELLTSFSHNEANFPEAHTFLVIEHQGREYVYDPMNPTQLAGGSVLPSLHEPSRSLLHGRELRSDALLIESKNVITGRSSYYGVGDGASVTSNEIAFFPKTETTSANHTAETHGAVGSEFPLPDKTSPLRAGAARSVLGVVPQAAESLLRVGINLHDGVKLIDAFRVAHPDVPLSNGAASEYAALYATAKAEQGMTGGLSQGIGLNDFVKWAEKNHIPPELRQALNPTDLGLARDGKTVLGPLASLSDTGSSRSPATSYKASMTPGTG